LFLSRGIDIVVHNYSFGGDGTLRLCYNSVGAFIGLTASLPANSSRTTGPSQYADSAFVIGEFLGIPDYLLASVEVSPQSSYSIILPPNSTYWDPDLPYQGGIVEWYNYSLVVAHSAQTLNLAPSGCNALGLRYDDDTGQLLDVEAWRFVELPSTCGVTSEEAAAIASAALPSYFYTDTDVVVFDDVTSIRLDFQTLRFGYLYEARVGIPTENSSYSVLLLVDIDDGMILHTERTLPVVGWHPVANAFPWLPVLLVFVLIVVVVGLCISVLPDFAWLVMGSFPVLAYIRLKGANVLDNFNRGRIMGFVSARPGASFTEIRDSLKIVNGNLAYHLCVLEKLELISSEKDGRSRRFYPVGVEYSRGENHFIGRTESKILEQLGKNGPLSNSAIAGFLGMSRQRTHYNLRLLQKRGLVDRLGSLWQIRTTGPAQSR
jgi:predicted transcriptional regulator